jgi:hypothetical protein
MGGVGSFSRSLAAVVFASLLALEKSALALAPVTFQYQAPVQPALFPAVATDGGTMLLEESTLAGPSPVGVYSVGASSMVRLQSLVAAERTASDGEGYGQALALSGSTALVGNFLYGKAPTPKPPTQYYPGAAYVFVNGASSWSEQQYLPAPPGIINFGAFVSVSGDTAVVGGAPPPAPDFLPPYNVYIYVRSGTTWTLQQEIDSPANGYLYPVALDGDTLLVGVDSGETVDVYTRSGSVWSLQQVIQTNLNARSMVLHGDLAVLGAPEFSGATSPGQVDVLARTAGVWSLQQVLTGHDSVPGDQFGYAVATDGSRIVVSAPYRQLGDSVYVFVQQNGVWTQVQEFLSPSSNSRQFGISVATSNGQVLVLDSLATASNVFDVYAAPPPPSVPALADKLPVLGMTLLVLGALLIGSRRRQRR